MMKSYVSKLRNRWDPYLEEDVDPLAVPIVYENDDPIPTGILDVRGNEFYRTQDRQPIGFCLVAKYGGKKRKPRKGK